MLLIFTTITDRLLNIISVISIIHFNPYNCKLFGLWGEDEHHNLDLSQIKIGVGEHGSYIEYLGCTAKNKTLKVALNTARLHQRYKTLLY